MRQHPRTVFDVYTCEPRLERFGFFRRETELCAEGVIPIRMIRSDVPCPGATARGARAPGETAVRVRASAASARVRSTASHVRSATSRTSAISVGVQTRGVSLIGAERGHHPPAFDQRHADERGDLSPAR